MPMNIFEGSTFSPEEIAVLIGAYERVYAELQPALISKTAIAMCVFDLAKAGEKDPDKLVARACEIFRQERVNVPTA
jgi:hypothetical protein